MTANTTFVSGAILTAAQMNALPFGVVALTTTNTLATVTATETVAMTTSSFTAIANRYYRITFVFGGANIQTTGGSLAAKIRLTNAAGTQYSYSSISYAASTGNNTLTCVAFTTLAAGATVIVGTVQASAGSSATGGGVQNFLVVEDIGPT